MTQPDPDDSMSRGHHKQGSQVFHLTVPGSTYDAMAFEFQGRRGGPWYSLDYDESKPTMHIPGEALPALRAMLHAIDGTPCAEMLATNRAAINVMVAHQRFDAGCLCGNGGGVGDSHAAHVLGELVKVLAGAAPMLPGQPVEVLIPSSPSTAQGTEASAFRAAWDRYYTNHPEVHGIAFGHRNGHWPTCECVKCAKED